MPRRLGPFTWQRWMVTFCLPVFGLRAISRPALIYGPPSCSLCVGTGSCLSRSTCRWTTSCTGASLTSRHGSGLDAASWNRASNSCGSTAIASAIQPRFDVRPETTGHRVPAGPRKQRRAQAVEPFGVGRELEPQVDIGLDDGEPLARRQMVEPVAQRADRLRRIVAMRARGRGRFARGIASRC